VSRQLGQFEAAGEKHWKKLTDAPRRDAVRLLRKLEKAIEPSKGKKAPARKKAGARRPAGSRA